MKSTLTVMRMALGIGVASLLAATTLSAQEVQSVSAKIPFAFVVDSQAMPAGHYKVTQLNGNFPVFRLQDESGKSVLTALGIPQAGNPQKPSLTFACYAGTCALAKITPASGPTAFAKTDASIAKTLRQPMMMVTKVSVQLKEKQ